jgi:FHS family L-fucose permease-like MFS transporter
MGYFFMAVPAGLIARRFGYKGGIIFGLALAAAGAFWFVHATAIDTYGAFLLGLFVLASGLACLETIANPYTTVLGPPESGATRINMAQTCNGIGWISGMFIGAHLILSATTEVNTSNSQLYIPYLGIGIAVAVLLVVFIFAKIPDLRAVEEFKAEAEGVSRKPVFERWHFTLGVVAQFLYVAAQTGVFSFFINYAVANISNLSDRSAGNLQTIAFALFATGRLVGSAVVGLGKPHRSLAVYAVINTVMMVLAMAAGGWAGVFCLMASFFFMSIMFPTIFALSIRGLGEHTKMGSSLLVMSIVGGAIMTPLMGWIADVGGMKIGFVIPLVCFAYIAFYGANWVRLEAKDAKA